MRSQAYIKKYKNKIRDYVLHRLDQFAKKVVKVSNFLNYRFGSSIIDLVNPKIKFKYNEYKKVF